MIGLILAPVVGASIGMLMFLGIDRFTATPFYYGEFFETIAYGITLGSVIGAILGLPPSFLIGWLAHIAMLRNGVTSLPAYIVLGICLSTLPGFYLAFRGFNLIEYSLGLTMTLLWSGAIGGVIFWLIRRPDRDAPNPPRK